MGPRSSFALSCSERLQLSVRLSQLINGVKFQRIITQTLKQSQRKNQKFFELIFFLIAAFLFKKGNFFGFIEFFGSMFLINQKISFLFGIFSKFFLAVKLSAEQLYCGGLGLNNPKYLHCIQRFFKICTHFFRLFRITEKLVVIFERGLRVFIAQLVVLICCCQ